MILMSVVPIVREHQVRRHPGLQRFEKLLDFAEIRKKPVAKRTDDHFSRCLAKKSLALRLASRSRAPEPLRDDPGHADPPPCDQLQNGCAAANFDVVRMCPNAEDL